MKRIVFVCLLFVASRHANAGSMLLTIDLIPTGSGLKSLLTYNYTPSLWEFYPRKFHVGQSISNTSGAYREDTDEATYSHNLIVSADRTPPICFQASGQVTIEYQVALAETVSKSSGDVCYQGPPEDPPPTLGDPGPQTEPTEWAGGTPIIINFANGNYTLTGSNSPVLFDIAATGTPKRIGWTAAAADEAFLWLDRNNNGIVDDGGELFGGATPLMNGASARNGFTALAEFDENQDGRVDEIDSVWQRLQLWRDLNHDGRSQPAEISPLQGSGVVAIDLVYHWTGRHDRFGNTFRYESRVWIQQHADISTPRPVYDIFFVLAN